MLKKIGQLLEKISRRTDAQRNAVVFKCWLTNEMDLIVTLDIKHKGGRQYRCERIIEWREIIRENNDEIFDRTKKYFLECIENSDRTAVTGETT